MLITIFTPTFNRAYTLSYLYKSLLDLTNVAFEWLIVDDGSIDNTEELINEYIKEGRLNIRYIKNKNSGKHIAINKGVDLARGELFFIVDSDDVLPEKSLQIIVNNYQFIKENNKIAGLAGRRGDKQGNVIGDNKEYHKLICSALDFRFKKKIKGDMAEVFKTKILKKYMFPQFEGENFCTEALIWNRIAKDYDMLWINEIIYTGEYLSDGLSANVFKIRKNSPIATTLFYSELSMQQIPFIQKIKAVSNYWRFSVYLNKSLKDKIKEVSLVKSVISLPLIFILLFIDNIRK